MKIKRARHYLITILIIMSFLNLVLAQHLIGQPVTGESESSNYKTCLGASCLTQTQFIIKKIPDKEDNGNNGGGSNGGSRRNLLRNQTENITSHTDSETTLQIFVTVLTKEVLPTERVIANITFSDLNEIQSEILINYSIKSQENIIYEKKSEILQLTSQKTITRELTAPENEGNYKFYIRASFQNQTAETEDYFTVIKQDKKTENTSIVYLIVCLAILILLLIIIIYIKKYK